MALGFLKLSLVPISGADPKKPFDCGSPVLNDFLRFYALRKDRLSIGKTFVAVDEEGNVAGYVTLSNAEVEARKFPEDVRKKLPRYPVPAVRIGKLAVDARFRGIGLGSWLLRRAIEKALMVSAEVGLYAVIVDAIGETAKGFYLKYGFAPFEEYPMTLYLPLVVAVRLFSEKP